MIDLLSTKDKQKIARGFYFRFIVVTLLLLAISFVVANVALLPAYLFSSTQKNTANLNLAKQKSEEIPVVDAKTEQVVTDLNNKMTLLEKAQEKKFVVSKKIINEIILEKMPDIKISKIFYQNDPAKGRTIKIDGTAPNRERLLLFKQALESNANFNNVDLPISNFIKGSDIKFSISLVSA